MHINHDCIECAFGQFTSVGGLKANCSITGIKAGVIHIFVSDRLYKEMSNKGRNNNCNVLA